MRIHFITAIVFLLSYSSFSQDWITDFEEAKSIAIEKNKTILIVFQGSDWCGPCIKLEKEIFNTDEFKKYAKDNFVMLQADFPKRKKNALSEELGEHNRKLAEKYNKNGYFPYVVILDKNGAVLGSTGYKKTTPKAYIELLESFKN